MPRGFSSSTATLPPQVKGPSQAGMSTLIRAGRAAGIPLVVSGCVPQGERGTRELRGLSLLGVTQIDRVVEAVEQTLAGNTVVYLERRPGQLPRLDLPKVRGSGLWAAGTQAGWGGARSGPFLCRPRWLSRRGVDASWQHAARPARQRC